MQNLPTTARSAPIYSPPAQALDIRLASLTSKLETIPGGGYSISDRLAPCADERRSLEARRALVSRSLEPSSAGDVGELIAAMMMGFGGARLSAAEAKRTTALYVSQLSRFPLWAVKQACEEAMRSGAAFAPSVAELAKAADQAIRAASDEIAKINRVLNANVYHEPDDSEKARIEQGFKDLLEKLKLNEPLDLARKPKDRLLTRDEARAIVEELRASPIELPPLSEAARATLTKGAA